jgi:hypothetical protein
LAMTYPIGWSVVTQTLVRRERWPGGLKVKGIPLVYPGQEVQPDQPVIRIEQAGLAEEKANVARSSLSASPVSAAAMDNGTRNSSNGVHSGETILAGLCGRVVDITRRGGVVIESRAAVVQGALGAGGQVAGVLTVWQASGSTRGQQSIPPGAILVIPGPLNLAMLRQALSSGISGVVASSISSRDLEGFLRTDLVQLFGSRNVELAQAHLPPVTLLLTEGLGTLAMPARTMRLLRQYHGSIALISGATSVHQAIFPELVISLPIKEAQEHPVHPDPVLAVGAQVRVCGSEYEGAIGEIDHLFTHKQAFASGIRARAARLRLEDGSTLVIPMALMERVG